MASSAITKAGGGWLVQPQTMDDVYRFAKTICDSDLCPKDYKHKPMNAIVAIQMGGEVGLQPMAALQNIAVINGRPSMWGDALLAVCLADKTVAKVEESFDEPSMTALCVITRIRNGHTTVTRQSFSQKDAERAGLWKKQGPWVQYPKRMLQMRARGFAVRDACADLTRGLISREEASDVPVQIHAKQVEPGGVYFHKSFPSDMAGKLVREGSGVDRASYRLWLAELHTNEQDEKRARAIDEHAAKVVAIIEELDSVEHKALPEGEYDEAAEAEKALGGAA